MYDRLGSRWLLGVSLIAICILIADLMPAYAQGIGCIWDAPVELSRSSTFSKSPQAIVDHAGVVHVFWGENNGETQNNSGLVDAINYSRWDGQTWTEPIDVLALEQIGTGSLLLQSVLLSDDGFLHILWSTISSQSLSGLYYSFAHVSQANRLTMWTTELVEPGTISGARAVIEGGYLHLVYADNWSVNYRRLSLSDGNWDKSSVAYQTSSDRLAVSLPRIAVGRDGIVHVVWEEDSAEDDWNPSGVFYARSIDQGSTWIDVNKWGASGRHGQPGIGIDGGGRVHIVWLRSVGSRDGRYYVWSFDRGQTWSAPSVLDFGSGFTGSPNFTVDGNGVIHFVNGAGTVFHSSWSDAQWSVPEIIPNDILELEAEGAYIVTRGGNQLLAFWFSPGSGAIYVSSCAIEAESVPFRSVPALSLEADDLSKPDVAQTDTSAIVDQDLQTPGNSGFQYEQTVDEKPAMTAPGLLLVSIVPVLLLIVAVVILYHGKQKHHW